MEIESVSSNVPVLVGVHMEISLSDNVGEYFAEMEGGVQVKEELYSLDDRTGRI